MPKSRYKQDPFFHDDQEPNKNTFIIAIRKPRTIGIFCYHCAITVLGTTIKEWKEAGATDEEINNWLPMELRH